MYENCIDWISTNERILSELKSYGLSRSDLAKFMGMSPRTVQAWLSNSNDRCPSIAQMGVICFFLRKKLDDIIVFDFENISKCLMLNQRDCEDTEIDEDNDNYDDTDDGDCNENYNTEHLKINHNPSREEYAGEVFRRNADSYITEESIYKKNFHITTIDELLLYLPLVDIQVLTDVLYRVSGNTVAVENKHYLYHNTEVLYKSIRKNDAKKFADLYREYYLKYPSVLLLQNIEDCEYEKLKDFKNIDKDGSLMDLYDCYESRKMELYDTVGNLNYYKNNLISLLKKI